MALKLPGTVIMEGILGSKAYGLDTPTSDTDIKGIYVANTLDLAGLHPPAQTVDHTNPDIAYHEVGKFIALAMKSNPTILEQLYLEKYEFLSEEGQWLVDVRFMFPSRKGVANAYGGYATQQLKKLQREAAGGDPTGRRKNHYQKYARHGFRLLQQGRHLLETGEIVVRVPNREELFAYGEMPVDVLTVHFEAALKALDAAADRSVLPEHPDDDGIAHRLRMIRWENIW